MTTQATKWTISHDYELYLEAKKIAEGTTLMLGTSEHVRVLWGMLEAAKEEIQELKDYKRERPHAFDQKVD